MPGWADFNGGDIFYGFPDLEGRGVKFAHDAARRRRSIPTRRTAARPRPRSPRSSPSATAASRCSRGAPLTEARVCQYENSSNGDFLIDRHPRLANVAAGRRRLRPRLQARPRGRPLRRRRGSSGSAQGRSRASASPPRAKPTTAKCIRTASRLAADPSCGQRKSGLFEVPRATGRTSRNRPPRAIKSKAVANRRPSSLSIQPSAQFRLECRSTVRTGRNETAGRG